MRSITFSIKTEREKGNLNVKNVFLFSIVTMQESVLPPKEILTSSGPLGTLCLLASQELLTALALPSSLHYFMMTHCVHILDSHLLSLTFSEVCLLGLPGNCHFQRSICCLELLVSTCRATMESVGICRMAGRLNKHHPRKKIFKKSEN